MLDSYAARIAKDGDGFLVTFPDVPEAITGGSSREEAVANAVEALELALLTYAGEGRSIPEPAAARDDELQPVPVSAAVAAKIALIVTFRDSGLTQAALARRLGKAETEVRRMLDPYHRTKLPAIEAGLRALGKRLVLSLEAAA